MILRELLEGIPTQLWDASRISSNARWWHNAEKLHTHLEDSLGLGLKRGPLLEYMFRSQASSDGWHLRNTFCSILATVRAVCLKIVTFKTNQRSPTASRDGAGRSGCQEHLKCGDILLTQWPVSNKPRSLNGNAWLECLLSSSVRRASLEIFFSKEGDVPEGNESMPTREYSKSKDFLAQSRPLVDVLPAQYLELKTSPGRFRNRLHVAESPKCPKWLQKPLRPKTLGLFQATGFLS